ncbi:hypothetical protein BD310DRAFT_204619 [Dichomitus squalens]|uniref:Uncharacterized protein n=1 Tax=Dichomitus squalens TaxID=114155 RepID=A0A4Q9PD59_9APHY|nr:hypothetical protein BD310DRAFT_204619 [Dichomitus squalens]
MAQRTDPQEPSQLHEEDSDCRDHLYQGLHCMHGIRSHMNVVPTYEASRLLREDVPGLPSTVEDLQDPQSNHAAAAGSLNETMGAG